MEVERTTFSSTTTDEVLPNRPGRKKFQVRNFSTNAKVYIRFGDDPVTTSDYDEWIGPNGDWIEDEAWDGPVQAICDLAPTGGSINVREIHARRVGDT